MGVGELAQVEVVLLAVGDERAADLVRLAERDALPDEPLRDVGREREPGGRGVGQPPVSKRSVATRPVTAGSRTSSWSTLSKTGSLSSCRSRS